LAINLVALIIHVVIDIILVSPVLWFSGRILVGGEKAKFTDAIAIVALGTIAGVALGALFNVFLASIVQLVIWLALIKHFFDCGWLKAFVISLVAVISFVIIGVILGLIGFALVGLL
jgi:hypothetical protein